MAFGWFNTVAEADTYFAAERLVTECWDDLVELDSTPDTLKEKILMNSYNRLYYDPQWTLPDLAHATAAELVILRMAQAEEAYYLCIHLADEDRRKGIQAQGVVQAGIVKEVYDREWLDVLPVPPFVLALLAQFSSTIHRIWAANIERVENEPDVNTDVRDAAWWAFYGWRKPY